jgi:murein DD-endopeptidase MepM/ murein hydrolase activator NlpD
MKLKIKLVLSCSLMMVVSMLAVLITQPIQASDGIELSPPFNGIPRVTAYFDHDTPDYTTDGFVHIYNGERKPATGYPTYTGEPYPYDGHDGWDFSMKEWTDVLAAAPGKVVVSEDNWKDGGYGHVIIIKHSNDYYTMYAHLRQRLVFEDDPVTVGQHIGESGDSGSPGSYHLHFGVRHGGYLNTNYSVDPFGWRGSGKDPLWDHNNKESSCLSLPLTAL